RAGVQGDGFQGVFFGALVIAETGVAGGGVEDPLGVVEDEVMIGVGGDGQLGQDVGASGEGLVGVAAVAHAGQATGFLQGELDVGAGGADDGLTGAGGGDHALIAAFALGQPG